ncbi:MAG: amidohydrolase family protein [Luteitalea sp.]|nr:amidohydrolase family protein [Luteitalea sp.]
MMKSWTARPQLVTMGVVLIALATSVMIRASQVEPRVASEVEPTTYAIQGARIVTLAGRPIERGTVVISDGRIAAVGADAPIPTGAEVIEAEGLQVYPGLFDAISSLGLTEIGAVAATNDETELGDFNPQLLAAQAVHPASEHIPVARASGLTHALSVPGIGESSLVPGQASAIHLAGWTIEEMLLSRTAALVVNWPTYRLTSSGPPNFSRRSRSFAEAKKEHDEKIRQLSEWLDQARHYGAAVEKGSRDRISPDRKLEALVPVTRGELPVLVNADRVREIKEAVDFCEKQKLRMILAGGADAYKLTDLLASKKIPVVLGPIQALPSSEDEPYDIRYTTPAVLHKAGVLFALGTFNSSDSRTLPYEIGNAVSYGLPWEAALAAITKAPAEIFGVADTVGTVEVGKLGNIIVTDGDPLEIQTVVKYLFVNGRLTALDNRHLRLYEQYRARPKPATK